MKDPLRFKLGGRLWPVPSAVWHRMVAREARGCGRVLASLSPDHRRVREYLVRTLPAHGAPLAAEQVADALALSVGRVEWILAELDRKRFFVARDASGAVSWAYPITVDATPHKLTFKTGERMTAA